MNVHFKSQMDDQTTLESLSSCSFQPPTFKPTNSMETLDIESNSVQNICDKEPSSSDCSISKDSLTHSYQRAASTGQTEKHIDSSKNKLQAEGKVSQEDLKRERNRRLAREFRARKKEEIRLYRSTIVNLTQKVRTLAAENQRLQQVIKEIQGKTTALNAERKAEKYKDEQIQKLQKQVLLQQLLLHRLKDNTTQDLWRQREKQKSCPQNDRNHSVFPQESYSTPLPPLNTLTQSCGNRDPLYSREQVETKLNRTVSSLCDIPLPTFSCQESSVEPEKRTEPRMEISSAIRSPDISQGFNISSLCTPIIDSPVVYCNRSDPSVNMHS